MVFSYVFPGNLHIVLHLWTVPGENVRNNLMYVIIRGPCQAGGRPGSRARLASINGGDPLPNLFAVPKGSSEMNIFVSFCS